MEFLDLLPHVNRVITQLKAITKKNLLEQMSEIAASHLSVSSDDILQALITREKLGSTGVGNGVAIPHARYKHR